MIGVDHYTPGFKVTLQPLVEHLQCLTITYLCDFQDKKAFTY